MTERTSDRMRGKAMRMVADGYSFREAAKAFGVVESTVWGWARKKQPEAKRGEMPEGIAMLHAWPGQSNRLERAPEREGSESGMHATRS